MRSYSASKFHWSFVCFSLFFLQFTSCMNGKRIVTISVHVSDETLAHSYCFARWYKFVGGWMTSMEAQTLSLNEALQISIFHFICIINRSEQKPEPTAGHPFLQNASLGASKWESNCDHNIEQMDASKITSRRQGIINIWSWNIKMMMARCPNKSYSIYAALYAVN